MKGAFTLFFTDHQRSRTVRAATAGLTAVAFAAGQFVVFATGAAPAGATSTSSPTVTFATPSVSNFAAKLSYSVNRLPHQIAGVACSITPKGGATSSISCGNQTGSSSTSTSYGVTLSALNAGTYSYRATVKLTDGGSGTNTTSFTIKSMPATCTVTHYGVNYDGQSHTATGSCTGIAGTVLPAGDLNLTGTTHTNTGTYVTDRWSFNDPTGDYTNPGGSLSDVISAVAAICSVSGYAATYDGNAHTATGACTGAGGAVLPPSDLNLASTTHNSAGSWPADGWSFSDSTGNYKSASGTVSDSIAAATANCTVTGYSLSYDSGPHTATGSCTGAGGAALPAGDLNLSATTHTNSGTYSSDSWSFNDPSGNYTSPGGTVSDAIAPATADCTVTFYSVTYDGGPHTATGSCTGISGAILPAGDLNLTLTTHTGPGTYSSDTWTFSDPGGNYSNPGGTVTDSIGPATADCTVTSYGLNYDGQPHTATGSCTGVGGAILPSSDLGLGSTTHTNAGDYSGDPWTFDDPSGNYSNPGGTVNDAIDKVAADCSVTLYSVMYDGSPHTASGSCTGLSGVSLPAADLHLDSTAHTDVGNYSDGWYFTDANYYNFGGTLADAISQAAATCTVTGYDTAYTGQPLTASGSCTGAGGTTLPAGDLDLSNTTHTDVGSYLNDTWTFTDPKGNYAGQDGEIVTDSITQAPVNCSVFGYSVTYDGQPHTATGECVGAGNGVTLPAAELDLSHTIHTDAGTYSSDAWTFTDTTGNYSGATGTVGSIISPATASCTVTGYDLKWDDLDHTATGSCTGVGGTALPSGDLNLDGTQHFSVGTYSDTWTFSDGTGNYTNPGGTVSDAITTSVVCTVTGYHVTYDGTAHTATGTCSDGTTDLTADLSLNQTSHTDAGSWTDTWTFHDNTDTYPDQSGPVGDSIGKADATCNVTGYDVPFDGTEHYITGTCTGVGGVRLDGNGTIDILGTGHTSEGTYHDVWGFNETNAFPDYNEIIDEPVTDIIGPPTTGGGTCSPCIS